MEMARRAWELDNGVTLVDPTRDALYVYSAERQEEARKLSPWKTDPHYFKRVRISAVALIKMVMHARSGGSIEIMGVMQGYTDGDTIVVTDAFGLPVEGTETRVNANAEGDEYMIQYLTSSREGGTRQENPVGWYHSHPGYGCWLSGIDVGTQASYQKFNDPWVAVVIDPDRTISAGRVEIGAFRTFPENYEPPASKATSSAVSTGNGLESNNSGAATIVPLEKTADFGAHANKYYALEVSHFKSTLDTSLLELLWNKYWVQTLSQSPLITNREFVTKQIMDLASKLKEAAASVQRTSHGGSPQAIKGLDLEFEKLVQMGHSITMKEKQGLMANLVKAKLFNDLGPAPDA